MDSDHAKLLLGNAYGFYSAVTRIANGGRDDDFPWPPFFANVGYAFELSLKAYILEFGGSEKDCHTIGHDLQAAVAVAHKLGLRLPHPEVAKLLEQINTYHRNHSFRYMKPMNVSMLPHVDQTLSVMEKHFNCVAAQLHHLLPA